MKDIVIIDNRSDNYLYQTDNGIPITDFEGDEKDEALIDMKKYLIERILPALDVREVITEDFLKVGPGCGPPSLGQCGRLIVTPL